ncbi:unnamed protein product [Adineta steineri]|uniref:Uncharacterized protein n=2 Tax=Adineta steineri TaxID=433720 RepID=A0A813TK15_9BILA|nr:unnamed protein product [Adineta steineri]CAF3653694.1 unnamed protein product [Adineta steineri]
MHICSDPLEVIHSDRSTQPWCTPFVSNNYDRRNILISSLCAKSKLIQRLQHKIDLYQTPTSNDAHQILRHLTNVVQQHAPNFVFNEIFPNNAREQISSSLQNIQQDTLPVASSVASTSQSSSLSQQVANKKMTDEHLLSKYSSQHSPNLSMHSRQINEGSKQSLSKVNENSFEKIKNKNDKDLDHRSSMVMSIPVPSMFSTPHVSDQQVLNSQLRQSTSDMLTIGSHHDSSVMTLSTPNNRDHHLENDRIISAIDLKSSNSVLPSHNQQEIDKISLTKQISSTKPSSTSSINDYRQEELSTLSSSSSILRSPSTKSQHPLPTYDENISRNERKNNYQDQSHRIINDNKLTKPISWVDKLEKKFSRKHLNTTSFNDISSKNISHIYIDDKKRIDLDHLNMREAINVLEVDLINEAFQALINKKKDHRQNGLMRILTAPSRCCRTCRTQRRLATAAQRSIDIAIKNIKIPSINN